MNPDAFYDRFEKVLALAPDTRPLADESVRSGVSPSRGDSGFDLLDPTFHAWQAIHAGARSFQQQIHRAATLEELVQLRERLEVLRQTFADLADTAGKLADAVIARRS